MPSLLSLALLGLGEEELRLLAAVQGRSSGLASSWAPELVAGLLSLSQHILFL
jgi:hypothetical protein